VNLEKSTMVKKYLTPLRQSIEKGPQMSQWSKSKILLDMKSLTGKGKQCCLANGQTVQQLLVLTKC
jgi:hypothetical protein